MRTSPAVIAAFALVAFARSSSGETPAPSFSPQSVVIDRFEARDARLSDALEALTVLAEKATDNAWHPTLVLLGDEVKNRRVTLSLEKPSLSAVLDQLARSANLDVLYGKNSVAISAKKS